MPFGQLRAALRREPRRAGLAQRGHASSAKLEPGQHSPERHSTGDVGTAPGHRATPSRPPATPRAGEEEEGEEEETPGGAASRHGRGPRARRRAPPAAPPPPGAAAPEAAAASSVPGVSLPLPPSRGGSGQRRTPGRPRPPGPPAPAYLGAAHRLAAARQLHPDPGGGRRPARRREGGPPVLLRPQHGQPHLEQALDAAPAPLQQAAFLRRDGELVRPRPRPGAAGRPAASRHQRRPRRAALRPRIPPGRGTTTRGIPGRAHGAASSPRAGRSKRRRHRPAGSRAPPRQPPRRHLVEGGGGRRSPRSAEGRSASRCSLGRLSPELCGARGTAPPAELRPAVLASSERPEAAPASAQFLTESPSQSRS